MQTLPATFAYVRKLGFVIFLTNIIVYFADYEIRELYNQRHC